jgi:GNAT superfamily N-acetyltransferase
MEASVGTRYRADVRPARLDDITGIWATLQECLNAYAPSFYPPVEMPYALQYMLDLIAQGLVLVAVNPDDDVVGVIVLDWAVWPWNRQVRYLYNQHYWVEPLWRGYRVAAKLLDGAKQIATAHDVKLLIETSMEDADTGKKERFIEKNGFRGIGGKFFFDPNQSM